MKTLKLVSILLLGITCLVSSASAEIEATYDARKNVITVRAQDLEGLDAIARQLNKPAVFSYDKSTGQARTTASIEFRGQRRKGQTISIGDPNKRTTLTFVCAPDAGRRAYRFHVERMAGFKLVNTAIRAENSVGAPGQEKFAGILLMKIQNVNIAHCQISDAHTAIQLMACPKTVIRDLSIINGDTGMTLGAGGSHVLDGVDIDTRTVGINFLNYTAIPEISNCNITTINDYSIFLAAGSVPKMTPNITLTSVRYDKQKETVFGEGAGIVSIAWHFKMNMLDEDGNARAGARLRFMPSCEFEVADVLGLLEPLLERTDKKGLLNIDLIEGVLVREAEAKRSRGVYYPYTYRIEIDEGKGFKLVEEAFSLKDNIYVEYRKQGEDYKKTINKEAR